MTIGLLCHDHEGNLEAGIKLSNGEGKRKGGRKKEREKVGKEDVELCICPKGKTGAKNKLKVILGKKGFKHSPNMALA